MGILSWIKLGTIGAVVIAAGIFYWSYQHRGRVIEAQKVHIEQLEAATKFYEAQPEIDRHTEEVKREIKKAIDRGDPDNVYWLYDQLRMHKKPGSGKSKTPAPPRTE